MEVRQEHPGKRSKEKGADSCQIESRGLGHKGPVYDQWLCRSETEVFPGGEGGRIADNLC